MSTTTGDEGVFNGTNVFLLGSFFLFFLFLQYGGEQDSVFWKVSEIIGRGFYGTNIFPLFFFFSFFLLECIVKCSDRQYYVSERELLRGLFIGRFTEEAFILWYVRSTGNNIYFLKSSDLREIPEQAGAVKLPSLPTRIVGVYT